MQLSEEQYNKIKQEIIEELKIANAKKWQKELVGVLKKYRKELVSINGGSTWSLISRMTAYLLGYKYTKEIPDDKSEEAANIAEELCLKVIDAFNKEGNYEK